MKRRIALITLLLTGVWCVNANAQFGDLLKKAKQKAKDAAGSKKPEPTESTDSTTTTTTTTKTTETTTTTAPADINGQPNLTAAKIDFVPGERTVFFDDFSDMAADEPPPHWKVRGGEVALKTGGSIRELAPAGGATLSASIPFPENFTFEVVSTGNGEMDWKFYDKENDTVMQADVIPSTNGDSAHVHLWGGEDLGEGETPTVPNQPLTFGLWVQNGRARAYLNGERLVDVNDVHLKGAITRVFVDPSRYRPNGIRSVRVAESAPDFSRLIASSGKVVTHGIHFDTDSDRIEPDSAGVIRQVASALEKNPTLKLEIDGYTDAVGAAAHNQDLSKRRAEAVKSVLVSQFNIDASRLTASGFGPAKPIAANDTADGRAANRRVEFVKTSS